MDLPDLVTDRVGDASVEATVDLGGGDAVVVTDSRTLVYRSDGLLRDESLAAFDHDVERLALSAGRSKTTFRLDYVDRTEDFSVPSPHAQAVLEPFLGAILREQGAVAADERIAGVYRFSELTLVVTDRQLLKHVGGAVWDEEFEVLPYADLAHLDFEEGSHATAVVVGLTDRTDRVKIPADRAGEVRRAVENAVFAFHGVDSLAALEELLGDEDDEDGDAPVGHGDFEGNQFRPLIDEAEPEKGGDEHGRQEESGPLDDVGSDAVERDEPADASAPGDSRSRADAAEAADDIDVVEAATASADTPASGADTPASDSVSERGAARQSGNRTAPEVSDLDAAASDDLSVELAAIRAALERQNDLLERQHDLLERLLDDRER